MRQKNNGYKNKLQKRPLAHPLIKNFNILNIAHKILSILSLSIIVNLDQLHEIT